MQLEVRDSHVVGVFCEIQKTKDLMQALCMVCANPFNCSIMKKRP